MWGDVVMLELTRLTTHFDVEAFKKWTMASPGSEAASSRVLLSPYRLSLLSIPLRCRVIAMLNHN